MFLEMYNKVKRKMNTKTSNCMLKMCRTCMSQFSKRKRKSEIKDKIMFDATTGFKKDTTIMDILQLVEPQINVEFNDSLPPLICSDCIKKLITTYDFIEMYRNTDKKFREMLKETDISSCENSVNALTDSLEIIVENHAEKILKNEDKYHETTNYELQIEELVIEDIVKEEKVDWPATEHGFSKDTNDDEEPLSVNFSSDDKCQKKDSEWSKIHELNINNDEGTTTSTVSEAISTKGISKQQIETDDILDLPVEHEDVSIQCQKCDKVMDTIELWQDHMRNHRLDKNPKRKYVKKSNKPRETTIKRTVKPKYYECEHCNKGFTQFGSYKSHIRKHSDEMPYLCIECGKNFKTVGGINTHMLRHKGEKNYQCQHCPKKFVCSSGLYCHMLTHSKKKPYVCDICGSAFHHAYELRKHNLYHNGIKKYKCEYCEMRFVTGEKQRRHMRTHTGEKPFRCKYCDKAFTQSNDCTKHLRQHLGNDIYQCDLCPQRFPLLRDMRSHFNTHKNDDEETRTRNLKARLEEERSLLIKLGLKEIE